MRSIDCPFQCRQPVEGLSHKEIFVCEKGKQDIPSPGASFTARAEWPDYPDLVVPTVQKNFEIGTSAGGGGAVGALAPMLESMQ
jgi:hypothetical protein